MFNFLATNELTGQGREFKKPLFPPAIKRQLQEFLACATALNDTEFVRRFPQVKISVHFGKDGRITDSGSLPSDEAIAAFLHRLRPIYLNNEMTNFNRIANLVSEHFQDPDIARIVRECKMHYDGRASQELFKFTVAGLRLNSQEFLDHYLNSLEYHRDPRRKAHIEKVAEYVPLEAQKPFVVLLLSMRINAVNKLSSFLLTCFDREDGRVLTLNMA